MKKIFNTVLPDRALYAIAAAVVLVIIVVLASLAFLRREETGKNNNQYACTMDAKICPDGSAVGRSGPKCEFSACPAFPVGASVIQKSSAQSATAVSSQPFLSTAFTEADYQKLKAELGVSSELVTSPALDFSKEYVIGFALGMRSSSGYTVSLKSVTEDETTTTYTFIESQPGQSCMTLTVIDYPYILLRRNMPTDSKTTRKQVFQVEKVTRSTCD